jgi:hypothetical protein
MTTRVVNIRGRGGTLASIPDFVYVGRGVTPHPSPVVRKGSPLGNPYKIPRDGTRAEVLEKYREHLLASPGLLALLPGLRGKTLGCWCVDGTATDPLPHVCHAQVLAELADGPLGGSGKQPSPTEIETPHPPA